MMRSIFETNPVQTACFTGHRVIHESDLTVVRAITFAAVRSAYLDGYRVFISGGARGFDTVAAREVLRFRTVHPDVRLVIAVPCAGQSDKWPAADRAEYHSILCDADQVIVLSDIYYDGCMQSRNRFMVDHSSLCFCYMTRFEGGTWSTVRYALHQGITLRNLALLIQNPGLLKENTWNCICTSRFASENVSTVRLFPFPVRRYRWTVISKRLFKKRK